MSTHTRNLIIYSQSTFADKFRRLSRKAAKLGLSGLSYRILGNVYERDPLWNTDVYIGFEVEITYPIIKLSDEWTLIGILDHKEHLSKAIPGQEFPAEFLGADAYCDYCRQSRHRIETFLVRNEAGEIAQVGRQCLGAFLGIDAGNALAQIRIVRDIEDMDAWTMRGAVHGRDLFAFLSHCQKAIRLYGWTSKTKANEEHISSTASLAWDSLDNRKDSRPDWKKSDREIEFEQPPIDADRDNARMTLEWMRNIDPNTSSDYLRNLWQIAQNDFVTDQSAGYAASAYNAMRKEQDEAREAEEARKTKSYVGKVGGKFEGDLILVRSASFDSEWGLTYIHRFEDESGNVIVWKTGTPMTECRSYSIKASIKDHAEYRGIPQTVITRAKFTEHDAAQSTAFDALRLQAE